MNLPGKCTEEEFLRQVIELARVFGWRTAHFRPAMTASGRWVTAVQGNGKGFPDLVLVRGDRILFVELKTDVGRLTNEQADWLSALKAAGAAVYLWRPADWEQIVATLKGEDKS